MVTVDKEIGQLADTVQYENIIKMWSRLWVGSRQTAVWLINQDVEPALYGMGFPFGTGSTPVYLPPNGLSGSPYGTLLGRPVITSEHCSTVGDAGDIILVDPSQYLLITKGNGIDVQTSMHVRFLYDEMTFRFILRLNGQPIWRSALTPFKGSLQTSPYITLAARA